MNVLLIIEIPHLQFVGDWIKILGLINDIDLDNSFGENKPHATYTLAKSPFSKETGL